MAYIYKILNKVNNKFYIGSTNNYKNRWSAHKWKLNNNKHENKHLQGAWNIYGKENFDFSIVEKCEEDVKFEREQWYLDNLMPFSPSGYNLCTNAGGGFVYAENNDYVINVHAKGENHHFAKLTNKEVIIIKKQLSQGVKQKYLVDNTDYSWSVIGGIASLDKWKGIGSEYNDKILSYKNKKWTNEMENKLIKLIKEDKSFEQIKNEFDLEKTALKRRYDYEHAKQNNKIKSCVRCGKGFIIKGSQKYCNKCRKEKTKGKYKKYNETRNEKLLEKIII